MQQQFFAMQQQLLRGDTESRLRDTVLQEQRTQNCSLTLNLNDAQRKHDKLIHSLTLNLNDAQRKHDKLLTLKLNDAQRKLDKLLTLKLNDTQRKYDKLLTLELNDAHNEALQLQDGDITNHSSRMIIHLLMNRSCFGTGGVQSIHYPWHKSKSSF